MKLTGYVTVETNAGDKMVPFSKDFIGSSRNALRQYAAMVLEDALRTTTETGQHKLRAVSLIVEA